MKGLNVLFYDFEGVKREFSNFGLIELTKIDEPIKHMENELPLKCILVNCKKKSVAIQGIRNPQYEHSPLTNRVKNDAVKAKRKGPCGLHFYVIKLKE